MIQALELTKKYEEGLLALDHLNLNVLPGQIYALLGANGAGKSTTINLFFNFIDPTSGTAIINGIDCTKNPLEAKKHVAYVSENVMLYPNFTARQNLDFFTQLAGRRNVTKQHYHQALTDVGLPEQFHEKRVGSFSKGMRQKLGIAIAILKQAEALLLDEPTSGLDPKAGADFIGLLLRLRKDGKAILMSTHDIFRAREIADVVGIMKGGKLVMEKTGKELEGENLESLYLKHIEAP